MKRLIKVVVAENYLKTKNYTKLFILDDSYLVEYKYTHMEKVRKYKTTSAASAECLFIKTALYIIS